MRGRKTGGRRKGSENKSTKAKRAALAASGLTPLDYFLSILRDESQDQLARFEAAKQAAPYCHHRLASVEHGGVNKEPIKVIISGTDAGLL